MKRDTRTRQKPKGKTLVEVFAEEEAKAKAENSTCNSGINGAIFRLMNERTNEQAEKDTVIGTFTLKVVVHAHVMPDERKSRNGRVVKNGYFTESAVVSVRLESPCFGEVANYHSVTWERLYNDMTLREKGEAVGDLVRNSSRLGVRVYAYQVCDVLAGLNEYWKTAVVSQEFIDGLAAELSR